MGDTRYLTENEFTGNDTFAALVKDWEETGRVSEPLIDLVMEIDGGENTPRVKLLKWANSSGFCPVKELDALRYADGSPVYRWHIDLCADLSVCYHSCDIPRFFCLDMDAISRKDDIDESSNLINGWESRRSTLVQRGQVLQGIRRHHFIPEVTNTYVEHHRSFDSFYHAIIWLLKHCGIPEISFPMKKIREDN